MDRESHYFVVGGLAAALFYLGLIVLLLLFFNDRHRALRYVPKKSQSLEVSLVAAPPVKKSTRRRVPAPKPAPPKPMTKKRPAPVPAPKTPTARKQPTAAKPAPQKPTRSAAIRSLFADVKVAPAPSRPARLANAPKIRYKPTSASKTPPATRRAEAMVRDINLTRPSIRMVAKSGGQGEVDAYMSRLYELLYGSWQPDPLYAGAKATVRLRIAPDGRFDYRILHPSDNQGFNESLIEYLDRLKRKGLPPHTKKRRYLIDVEFKAKE